MAAVTTHAVRAGNSLSAFTVVPTGMALGAEIRGVDFSQPVPEEVAQALREAWAEHLVLLFRGQQIRDEHLLGAAQVFGGTQEAGSRKYLLAGGFAVDDKKVSSHNSVSIVSNLDKNGVPVKDNGGLGSLEVVWHSDNSYVEVPPAGSMLYSLEVPINGGGDTSFNNQYLAYEELPEDLKHAIEGRFQRQDSSRNSAGVLRPTAKLPSCPEEVMGPVHPLVRVHPVTGKRALYLGRRRVWPSNYILGLPNDESEKLLDRLWAHATQPKYAWTHVWGVGELILWDNRCCMHYRTEIDVKQRRVMHRTVIRGEAVISPWGPCAVA
jgi:taurine dioxygenase